MAIAEGTNAAKAEPVFAAVFVKLPVRAVLPVGADVSLALAGDGGGVLAGVDVNGGVGKIGEPARVVEVQVREHDVANIAGRKAARFDLGRARSRRDRGAARFVGPTFVRAADLADMRLVDRCHCENHELFARAGTRIETAAIAHSEEWALALVALGMGMAIVPEGVAQGARNVAMRQVVDVDVKREVGLAFGASASTEVQKLVKMLRAQVMRQRRRP